MVIVTKLSIPIKAVQRGKIFDPYTLHKFVYKLFDNNKPNRILFADKGITKGYKHILILSGTAPNQPDSILIDSKTVPPPFLLQTYYNFEILINPVQRDNKTGALKAIKGRENVKEWFINKSVKWGFEVNRETITINSAEAAQFEKNGITIFINSANICGELTVINEAAFIKAFENGIGRAKAFGYGLLQLAPKKLF